MIRHLVQMARSIFGARVKCNRNYHVPAANNVDTLIYRSVDGRCNIRLWQVAPWLPVNGRQVVPSVGRDQLPTEMNG